MAQGDVSRNNSVTSRRTPLSERLKHTDLNTRISTETKINQSDGPHAADQDLVLLLMHEGQAGAKLYLYRGYHKHKQKLG